MNLNKPFDYGDMVNPLKYQMVIQWSEADQCFLVDFLDFPGQQWRTQGR